MRRLRHGVLMAALGLFACDAETHIRLLEPIEDDDTPRQMDASPPASEEQPQAGGGGVSDPDAPITPTPDAAPPSSRPDSGPPPVVTPDAGSPPADPEPVLDSLVLRYDFSGSGDVVPDLIGDQDARLLGGTLLSPDRTYIGLDGMDDYVDLPNGVVSGLRNATFILWLSWYGGVCWQRIFDFGISDQGEDEVGNGVTSLFMTPRACGVEAFTAIAETGDARDPVADDQPLPTGYAMQVALVFDGDNQTLTLYRDTEQVGEATTTIQLEQLTDANNWLGRSQWAQDAFFRGSVGEFRIYSRALSAEEIARVRAEGFNPP
jgi:hypothetical protein